MSELIRTLFAQNIDRRIEEVIKVDQDDEAIVRQEIREYITTDAIQSSFIKLLDRYLETPNKRHEGIGIWVSGFFGSGKSSFAKYLGFGVENRLLEGQGASTLLAERFKDPKASLLLHNIAERIPTHVVIFDVSTERSIKAGQPLTEITYKALLKSLGYAQHLDLAELEIAEEVGGRLEAFKATYHELYGEDWDNSKHLVSRAMGRASAVMSKLEPQTYPEPGSWVTSTRAQADLNTKLFAARCESLMAQRAPGKALMFVIDEVGQFVSKDVQKMLDLQAIVQELGRVGRGRFWIVATSQEKLTEMVSGLDDKAVELARVMDRFPLELQVHLEPSDISEVTSKRVLEKDAAAEAKLRKLFDECRARLVASTKVEASIKLPELSSQTFADLYPVLPYQVDLIIQIVSGLRTQGGASKHVGGANRTIIKLAQQLLVNPGVALADKPVGQLVTLDMVYDLVSGNIESEIRGKIQETSQHVGHKLAPAVAKAICLLQFVPTVPRTAENIAAVLHHSIDADSRLPQVKEALAELEKALLVRQDGKGQYRIPSPIEDDWERRRNALELKTPDRNKLLRDLLTSFWEPQPSQNLQGVKQFKAGLLFNSTELVNGDIPVNLHLLEEGAGYVEKLEDLRRRSQAESLTLFWASATNQDLEEELRELFRSQEILNLKRKEAQTPEQSHLHSEETRRMGNHKDELRRRLKEAVLGGSVYFRGNDRSPAGASSIDSAVKVLLGQALPEVYHRFDEAAARVDAKDLQALMGADSLKGLTPVFTKLGLLKEEGGKARFDAERPPLADVLARIKAAADYGNTITGKILEEQFRKEPFGWEFDMVKLLVLCLLRAGLIEVQSAGRSFDDARSMEAKTAFTNNTAFRQASFRPKETVDFALVLQTADAFKSTFGREAKELEQGKVAQDIRVELERQEQELQAVHTLLIRHNLPGDETIQQALDLARDVRGGKEEHTIQAFRSNHLTLKDAIQQASELKRNLDEPKLLMLQKARDVLRGPWAFLSSEPELAEELKEAGTRLKDLIERESFHRDVAEIERVGMKLQAAFQKVQEEALSARAEAYQAALHQLQAMTGWTDLDENQKTTIAKPLTDLASAYCDQVPPIPQLRADRDAASMRLQKAQAEVMHLLEGERLVSLKLGQFFNGGIENADQLEAALDEIRNACAPLLASGKKVLIG